MRRIALALLAASLSTAALAEPLPAPLGEPALVIAGSVAKPNMDSDLALDLATIAKLGESTIDTTTDWDWHDGVQYFAGVPLLAVSTPLGPRATRSPSISVSPFSEIANGDGRIRSDHDRAELEKYGAVLLGFVVCDQHRLALHSAALISFPDACSACLLHVDPDHGPDRAVGVGLALSGVGHAIIGENQPQRAEADIIVKWLRS